MGTRRNEMTKFEIDTRSYSRGQFVSELIESTCGSHTNDLTADQIVKYINRNAVIIDFDGEVMPANRWRDDIISYVFDAKFQATKRLCKTDTDPEGETTLADWMQWGEWESMTPAQMAEEWDENNSSN